MTPPRIFLLSPANAAGPRGRLLRTSPNVALATRLTARATFRSSELSSSRAFAVASRSTSNRTRPWSSTSSIIPPFREKSSMSLTVSTLLSRSLSRISSTLSASESLMKRMRQSDAACTLWILRMAGGFPSSVSPALRSRFAVATTSARKPVALPVDSPRKPTDATEIPTSRPIRCQRLYRQA